MFKFRSVLFGVVALFALTLGVLSALPHDRKNFVRIEINEVSILAETATNLSSQARGLSGRKSLGAKNGMLFVFEKSDFYKIWMKDMGFPIDIIWISKGRVADLAERVPNQPKNIADALLPIYESEAPADFVLEVNAGFAAANNIKIGDEVKILSGGGMLVAQGAALPGYEYFIESLQKKTFDGRDFKIGKMILDAGPYQKYSISYKSGDFSISGVMNIPAGSPPGQGYPVLILNHGLITPDVYFSGRGSKREQDFFARHGYVTIHPDYRGLASSSPANVSGHDFYQGYAEDVINALEALKKARFPYIDTSRIGMWGHSMGGGIAARVMVLRPDIKAFVLFASLSADAEDNFYELSDAEVSRLHEAYGPSGSAAYRKISPIEYFDFVRAPVQLHHGTSDSDVPIAFSGKIYKTLRDRGKKAEFFQYPRQKHEFIEDWPLAAERALQFFDIYVKNAK